MPALYLGYLYRSVRRTDGRTDERAKPVVRSITMAALKFKHFAYHRNASGDYHPVKSMDRLEPK